MGIVKIGRQAFLYPMPMVIVGADVEGRPNFLAVVWAARTNWEPPIMGISLEKTHHTNRGIRAHGEFSICVPGRDLVVETD